MKQNKNNIVSYEQLFRINKVLEKQLKQAHAFINVLQSQNALLKQKLAAFQNQQSTVHIQDQRSDQEVFTDSSKSDSEEFHSQQQNLNEQLGQLNIKRMHSQQQHIEPSQSVIMTPLTVAKSAQKTFTHPKVIFNYQSQGSYVPKVLLKQPKKQGSIKTQQNLNQINNYKWTNFNVETSAIKSQQPILLMKNSNTIFQRVRNSNKIYDYFFVTGYSFKNNAKTVEYCFPSESEQFSAILSLIYTDNSLRLFQNLSSGKSPRSNKNKGRLNIKDTFAMILYKQKNFQRQYLFGCQVDDIIQGPDKTLYTFNRLFCFITSCTFFSALTKIIQQFVNKINNTKQDYRISSPLNQFNSKQLLKSLLEDHLKILSQKNVKENQYVNFGLGNQINIFIDVPSSSQSYRTLLEYRPWGILFSPVYLANQPQQVKQKQLFGYLIVYMLTQTKILLYSMVKSKVSQALLHALQMIKPLQYVNPIIMATIRDEHQQYFNAPMSVVLGLWGQQKPKRKQKIQIFMNKKPTLNSLTYIVQESKSNQLEGVIFNLDTGYTFGTGLTHQKNKLACQLNHMIQSSCKSSKEKYKLIQNLIAGRSNIESQQLKELSDKMVNVIKKTQLYSFYLQKNNSIIHS